MGKAVRIAIGAALPLMKDPAMGIIIGTANGGMEDCIKFLDQIIEYQEGMLTPGNFVQSTTNAIAAQLGLISKNKGYNITHVHRGLSFENALLDAIMITRENPAGHYLVGGVDEISSYDYNIECLAGWYRSHGIGNEHLYQWEGTGSLAGEGASMFRVSASPAGARAQLTGIRIFQGEDLTRVEDELSGLLAEPGMNGQHIDLLLSGENGDARMLPVYNTVEKFMQRDTAIARFKHMTGEFATASAVAAWLACHLLEKQELPDHMLKKGLVGKEIENILVYNTFKGRQHSFMLFSKPLPAI